MGEAGCMGSQQSDNFGGTDPNRVCSLEMIDKGAYLSSQSSMTMVGSSVVEEHLLDAAACSERALAMPEPPVAYIDWENLNIENPRDEEGRIDIIGHDVMYELLGMREEDERVERDAQAAARADTEARGTNGAVATENLTEGAAIPIDDILPEERHPKYDKNKPIMKLGITYPNMKEFRMAVRTYAMIEEFELGTEKSCTKRFRGFCTVAGCPWRICGNKLTQLSTIMVTLLVDEHTCTSTARLKTTTPTQAWVAEKAVPILTKNPNMRTIELQKKLQDDYSVTIHYDTIWKGRERAPKKLHGSWEESFHMLYRWKTEIEKRSPGSVVELDTEVVNGEVYFHKFFCALAPCIEGFKAGCRPYLAIDSTALNGRWNGHLPATTGVDGHNWMFPVAFGFFYSENEDNWVWFMTQLNKALGNPHVLAIHTDACKGLENAVKKVFPQAEQRECFRHLMQNFIKRWCNDTYGHIYPAARAYRSEVFEEHLTKVFEDSPDVYKWLKDHHSLKWTRCKFNPEIKCDYVTSNLAECFNNWIKDIKDLPVVDLADKIREMVMKLWEKRRIMGERFTGYILPAIKHQLRARTRGLAHMTVVKASPNSAEVYDNNLLHTRHVVKLATKECTCHEWQHTGKPCDYALAFLSTQRNIEFDDYVHEYYSVARFRAAYQLDMEPLTGRKLWPEVALDFVVRAPLDKRSVGRQRKNRIKGCLEAGGGNNSKSKIMIRGPHQCKRCGERGHRQSSYKCPLNGTKKKPRKPRRNKTKELNTEPATPKKSTMSRETVIQESWNNDKKPSFIDTWRRHFISAIVPTCKKNKSPSKTAAKKMTPKKRKRN